jgi:ABC-type transporter Mla maintaining outer membrane lipid asymmetry ATPase subunit MlaF
MICVCSDPIEAKRLCKTLGFLNHGKFIETGTSQAMQASENPEVRQFFNGLSEGPLTEKFS